MKNLLIALTLSCVALSAHAKGCYDWQGDIVAIVGPYDICPPGSHSRR